MGIKKNPGAVAAATGAGKPIHEHADGTQDVAQETRSGTRYCVTPRTGEVFRIVVTGRDRWALEELRRAGAQGCTPIDTPAPRWSAYVFNLRTLGVDIETITELHGGDFAGHHARYVLRSSVARERQGVLA